MRYPPKPMQDPLEPVQRYPMPGQQPTPPAQQPQQPGQPPYAQPQQQYAPPMQQQYSQPMQPVQQQYSQPMQPVQPVQQQYSQPMQPVQPVAEQPSQPMPPVQQPMEPGPDGTTAIPLEQPYRRIAGLYIRDTWIMLAALLAVLVVIFIIVRLATRGYLWGLVFVLIAAVAAEFPALRLWVSSLTDFSGGRMLVQTAVLQSVTEDTPGLLSRLGLSSRARYCLRDDQGRSYHFTAEKGLTASFSDLEGAEAEIACLEHSRLMTGISPVRRTEHLSVMGSARERHLRLVFRDYLPV